MKKFIIIFITAFFVSSILYVVLNHYNSKVNIQLIDVIEYEKNISDNQVVRIIRNKTDLPVYLNHHNILNNERIILSYNHAIKKMERIKRGFFMPVYTDYVKVLLTQKNENYVFVYKCEADIYFDERGNINQYVQYE